MMSGDVDREALHDWLDQRDLVREAPPARSDVDDGARCAECGRRAQVRLTTWEGPDLCLDCAGLADMDGCTVCGGITAHVVGCPRMDETR